ncbi:MarR family transcriptional regulator [Microbacterium sp. Re1]|uniref:MarR family transcriptional regulator n=1 Tax=Microbacterium commune TaxID=2762219 RepID=A0ABR8W5A1_9MICO|nr:MarR family transcriptional regulator [Microbacterium commune]MBD8012194.1 MarR family transcriptional regulator [Microbacterium commune]
MPADAPSPESVLVQALTLLVARWSSPNVQRAVAQSAGVTVDAADVSALYVLGLHGPLRAGDLAEAMHISRPTVSKQLSRLERAGMIRRESDPVDGRATIVGLSAEGAAAHRRLLAQGIRMMRHALRDTSRDDAAALAAQVAELVARLGVTDFPGDSAGDTPRPHPERRSEEDQS